MLIPRLGTPHVSGDPYPHGPRGRPDRLVSLLVLAVGVCALTACQGPSQAAGNPLSSLGIGGSSPTEFCQGVQQTLQVATTPDPSQPFLLDWDKVAALRKRMIEAAPAEIRGDVETEVRASDKSFKLIQEFSKKLASHDPAGSSAAIAAANDAMAAVNSPEVVAAGQRTNVYIRARCGIDLPRPADFLHLKDLPSGSDQPPKVGDR